MACDTCGYPADGLVKYAGDAICEACERLFTAANALFDNGITDEAEIVGTLAFAHYASEPADRYNRLKVLKVVDGVPVLRLKKAAVRLLYYDHSVVAKAATVEVLSRHATPEEISALYKQVLDEGGIHYDKCAGGALSWSTKDHFLAITVKPEKELPPSRQLLLREYPRGAMYSFPPPSLVREMYRTLLGSRDPRALSGYAYALGDHGRPTSMTSDTIILGCVAWILGEQDGSQKPRDRRPKVARALNRHLLGPLDRPLLMEDGWLSSDTIWRDAAKVSERLMRTGYLLQREDSEIFKQRFSKNPV